MYLLLVPVIVSVVLGILILWKMNHHKREVITPKVANTIDKPPSENYITPAVFEVGLIKGKPYEASNNCLPNVLYPINGLGVEYGSKMPDNCPCTQFVQSP